MRSIVITGASRGLGLASAAHFYHKGWKVIAAMRSVESGMERLRSVTGSNGSSDKHDPRLIGVKLDLADSESIANAAQLILQQVGAPDVIVHNAGLAAAGSAEETPMAAWQQLFATNLFGPVELTKALLPAMREKGQGRIVVISSQGGIRGMPGISTYSASKGALERWAESMSHEIAPFGLGVTILVTGTFKTEILTEQTPDYGDHHGPYAKVYEGIHTTGREFVDKNASPPEKFAQALAAAVEDDAPIRRRTVGPDAAGLYFMARLLPGNLVHKIIAKAMKLPRRNALKDPSSIGRV
ncbi:SDR family oxidoreductase [Ketobacter sp.]|uniref:SDR family oxidoreductase n=1 Tax=Ketobacter sp. TaxID=2083498 RepID=UPI000F17947D|nr:SDR family oxidoreductase [Ketobacter sp.]RLT97447.1 MAG: SDR family oxidoreductase [Ketobacter sp.]